MSAARRKGNALELEVARRLHEADGRDPRLAALETDGGRLGPVYSLQIDIASQRFVAECKNREDLPARLWDWLGGLHSAALRLRERLIDPATKTPILVLKRNRRRPLVVLYLDDFEYLIDPRLAMGEKVLDMWIDDQKDMHGS